MYIYKYINVCIYIIYSKYIYIYIYNIHMCEQEESVIERNFMLVALKYFIST